MLNTTNTKIVIAKPYFLAQPEYFLKIHIFLSTTKQIEKNKKLFFNQTPEVK